MTDPLASPAPYGPPDGPGEDRRQADRRFLRALGIRPCERLLAGDIDPRHDHPLFRFGARVRWAAMAAPR